MGAVTYAFLMDDSKIEFLSTIGKATVMALFRYEELLLGLASGVEEDGENLYQKIREAYREDSLVSLMLLHNLGKIGIESASNPQEVGPEEDNPLVLLPLLRPLAYSFSAFALVDSEEDIRPELLLSQDDIEALLGSSQIAFMKKWGEEATDER